jgi:hypothetical protein
MRPDGRRLAWVAGGAALSAGLAGALALGGPLTREPRTPSGPPPVDILPLQQLEGTVKLVEPGGDHLVLARGLLGLDVTHVRVEPQTHITVGNKEGAIGDLREGRRVRVVYQVGPSGPVARSIAVLEPHDAVRARASAPPPWPPASVSGRGRAEGTSPTGAPDPARRPAEPGQPRAVSVEPGSITGGERAAPARRERPPGAALLPRAASGPDEGGRPTGAPGSPEAVRRAASPPGEPAPRGPTGRNPAAEEEDPAAVVDWLLREHAARRR